MYDIPSSNAVWKEYLLNNGFIVRSVPCCITIREFSRLNFGDYILATGSHVVHSENGIYYDTWDSGDEIVMYYFERN